MQHPLQGIPAELSALPLELSGAGSELTYTYDAQNEHSGIAGLLQDLDRAGIAFKDLQTSAEFAGRYLRQPGEGTST